MVCLTTQAKKHTDGLMGAMRDEWGIMTALVMSFTAILPVGGLFCYHMYLVAINQTTNEEVNDIYKRAQNPFNRGARFNCWEAWCQPQRISRLLSDEMIEEKMGIRNEEGQVQMDEANV